MIALAVRVQDIAYRRERIGIAFLWVIKDLTIVGAIRRGDVLGDEENISNVKIEVSVFLTSVACYNLYPYFNSDFDIY